MRGARIISILSISLMLGLVSCGKKKDDKISVELIPAQPIVFDVDWVIPDPDPGDDVDDSVTISKNWFQFRFKVENKLASYITIMVIKADVTGVKDGEIVKGSGSVDPGDFTGDGASEMRSLMVVEPGKTGEMTVPIFLDGLPEVSTLKYSVHATFKGWVGNETTPEGPLTYEMDFKTANPN